MTQIVYRDRHGEQVCVKNPTDADMDRFWEEWRAIHGTAFRREFMRQMRGSKLFEAIAAE